MFSVNKLIYNYNKFTYKTPKIFKRTCFFAYSGLKAIICFEYVNSTQNNKQIFMSIHFVVEFEYITCTIGIVFLPQAFEGP